MVVHEYTRKDAIRILTVTAKDYKNILEGRNFLFVFRNRVDNNVDYFETLFLPKNFQHLTGVEYVFDGIVVREPIRFYNDCVDGRIRLDRIQFRKDGTTQLKLVALPKIVNFISSSKMTGLYNRVRPKLAVDRLSGTTNFCLGFARDGRYYAPSSCLLEEIRDLTDKPSQILAVMSKKSGESVYKDIRYVAKGLPFNKLKLPKDLGELIDRS